MYTKNNIALCFNFVLESVFHLPLFNLISFFSSASVFSLFCKKHVLVGYKHNYLVNTYVTFDNI